MAPRAYNQYGYVFNPETDAESNDGTIHVVPDQSYTLQEILERFTLGLPIDDQRRPVRYDDDYEDLYDEESEDGEDGWDVHPNNELGHDLTDIDEAVSFVKDVKKRTPKKK